MTLVNEAPLCLDLGEMAASALRLAVGIALVSIGALVILTVGGRFRFRHLVEHSSDLLSVIKVFPLIVKLQNDSDNLQDFVHIDGELRKPLPGVFLLHHTGNM